jgi:hypothetical protein
MRKLLDWVQFKGWRNTYWREDAAMSRCNHDRLYFDEVGALCVECGQPLGRWDALTTSSSAMTTVRYKFWIRS